MAAPSSWAFTLLPSSSILTSKVPGLPPPSPPAPKSPSVKAFVTGTSPQIWMRGTGPPAGTASSSCFWNWSTSRESCAPLRARYSARSSSRALAAVSSETRVL